MGPLPPPPPPPPPLVTVPETVLPELLPPVSVPETVELFPDPPVSVPETVELPPPDAAPPVSVPVTTAALAMEVPRVTSATIIVALATRFLMLRVMMFCV